MVLMQGEKMRKNRPHYIWLQAVEEQSKKGKTILKRKFLTWYDDVCEISDYFSEDNS
jgi:hypothetical protein